MESFSYESKLLLLWHHGLETRTQRTDVRRKNYIVFHNSGYSGSEHCKCYLSCKEINATLIVFFCTAYYPYIYGLRNNSLSFMRWSNTIGVINWIQESPKGFILDLITPTVFDHLLILKEWFFINCVLFNNIYIFQWLCLWKHSVLFLCYTVDPINSNDLAQVEFAIYIQIFYRTIALNYSSI